MFHGLRGWLLPSLAAGLLAACAPVVKPAGPPVAMPRLDGDRLIAADGAVLPLETWLPAGRPRAVILGLHGFNDHAGAFALPGRWWANHGIATYAFDQRGFGSAPNRGYWAGTATLAEDLRAAGAAVKARHAGAPLWIVGDSMGAAVAMVALAGRPPNGIAGVVLVAPAVWGRAYMTPVQRGLLWLLARTIPWYPLTGQGLNRRPSDNVEMLKALARDPKVIHGTRVDTLEGLVDLMDAALDATAKLDRLPVLMLYGLNDEIVPERPVLAAMRRLPRNGRTRAALYAHGYHMLLRDLAAEQVWRDIASFITAPDRPLPSGADARAAALLAKTN